MSRILRLRSHSAVVAVVALVALTIASVEARAQAGVHETGSSSNLWMDVGSDSWLTPQYDVTVGLELQRSKLGAAPQQSEVRVGLQRSLGSRFRLAASGVLVHNSPYGPFPATTPNGERRLWEQLLQDQHAGRVVLQHRYRLEERWVEHPLAAGGDGPTPITFALRARYQLRATLPLVSGGAHAPYVAVYDELFRTLGPRTLPTLLDQNRSYVGAGLRWSAMLRTEVGYLDQRIVRAGGRQREHGQTVLLSVGLTRPAPARAAPVPPAPTR